MNPLIPGYAPDPSVVKVDEWYFLVNSSFHTFPGLPIYASHDLNSWRQIGNGINRPEKLSLAKSRSRLCPFDTGEVMLASGGLYAPTIRFHQGVFYIACTNILHLDTETGEGETKPENFIISTKDIWADQWSDPMYFAFKGIDPDIFFDDDGKVYVHGSQGPGPWTKIQQFEIDLQTGAKLSPERTIWRGTGGIYPEGPHMYKQDGWYYLMISEGGTHEGHMVTMARSKDVEGPFDSYPNNPILTAAGTDNYIQYTGHCDIFQDEHENWWGVCLGVRKDSAGRFMLGRETFLTHGSWDGEWPRLENVKPVLAKRPVEKPIQSIYVAPEVEFAYIRNPKLGRYEVYNGGQDIVLQSSTCDFSSPEGSPTFIGKRQRRLEGRSEVLIHAVKPAMPDGDFLRVGLACIKEEHRYLRIFHYSSASEVVFEFNNAAKKLSNTERCRVNAMKHIYFKLSYTEQECSAWYAVDQDGSPVYTLLATVDTLDMTGPDFVGPLVGVFAVSGASEVKATFTRLLLE